MKRPKFYFAMIAGCVGAGLFGAVFDQVTVSISPAYFIVGKGMDPDGLRLSVAWLGFRSALPLGAAVIGLALLRKRQSASFTWSTWFASLAAAVAIALPVVASFNVVVDPSSIRTEAAMALSPDAIDQYLLVWGLHIGVYLGCVAGTALAWCRTRAQRGVA